MEVEPIDQAGTGHKVGDHMTILFNNGDTENLTALLGFEYGFETSHSPDESPIYVSGVDGYFGGLGIRQVGAW